MKKIFRLTSKGQVTIPKEVRKVLNSEYIEFEIDDKQVVIIKPIKDIAGCLKKYAKEYIPIDKAKNEAWDKAVNEKRN